MRDTVYDRFVKFKVKLKKDFPELDDMKVYRLLGKLASWHYPKKRWTGIKLSKEEARLYEWILNFGCNPDTVYKWYRILGFNKEIQEKLRYKQITLKEAKTYNKPFRRLSSLESELMYQIRQSITRYLVR